MSRKNEFSDVIIKGDLFISDNVKQPESKLQWQGKMLALKEAMDSIGSKIVNSPNIGKTKHLGLRLKLIGSFKLNCHIFST